MSAVLERSVRRQHTRDEVARRVAPLLGDEPQSATALAERLNLVKGNSGPDNSIVLDACNVLFARRQARRIPNTAGSPQGGWVRWDSPLTRESRSVSFTWPFKRVEWIAVTAIGIDPSFQRPLTTFAAQIENNFDAELFGVLILSDRGAAHEKEHGWRYSAIDGQTRWVAVSNLGADTAPSIVYTKLTPEQEAGIFWRLQKHRKAVISSHTFRARVREGDPIAIAVTKLVAGVGFEIGTDQGQIRSSAALETCYKRDALELERALADFGEGWPGIVPAAKYIKGLHYFLLHYPVDKDELWDIDDELLVRRLQVNGPREIDKKLLSVTDLHTGSADKLMALAFQAAYSARGKK